MTARRRLSNRDRLAILERQHYRCACGCGEPLNGRRFEFDHRLPLALGGPDTPANIEALLVDHHRRKTRVDIGLISKADRQKRAAVEGRGRKPRGRPMRSRGFDRRLRKKIDGTVERRQP